MPNISIVVGKHKGKNNSCITFSKEIQSMVDDAFGEVLEIELLNGDKLEHEEVMEYKFNIEGEKAEYFKRYAQEIASLIILTKHPCRHN